MSETLFAAYAVFWGLTFAFVMFLWARQRRIRQELKRLDEALDRNRSADG